MPSGFKKVIFAGVLCFILARLPLVCPAQQFPIQVTTTINPPYSVYLADYVEGGTNRISVTIYPVDVNLNNYKAKLKLVIESLDGKIHIETNPQYNPAPMFLQGGVMEMLTAADLYDLFNVNNLQFTGYSLSEYLQTRKLPEGIYRMGIKLVDYNYALYEHKEVVVSNLGYGTAYLFLNDPPILNLPLTNCKVKITDPQNIIFQWTPRHRGSPNSAFNAQYQFRLYEVWGPITDPNVVVNTQMPIFETTTNNTRYVYGLADPALIPGKNYVWTVQAFEPDNLSLFRNQGLSEAFIFVYGDECRAPDNFAGYAIRGPGMELKWKGGSGVTDYLMQYQVKDYNQWYDQPTLLSNMRVYDLTPGTIYQARVKANCGTFESPFSETLQVQIPPENSTGSEPLFACGSGHAPEINNHVPQPSLTVGATFWAGGFKCLITEVSGSNGVFTGKCNVTVPFYNYAKVPHLFNQIQINELNQMTAGVLKAEIDTANPLMEKIEDIYTDDNIITPPVISLDELLGADTTILVNGTIDTIVIDGSTGNIVITTTDGTTTTVTLNDDDETAVVTDADGNQYYVANGQVYTAAEAIALASGVNSALVSNIDSMMALLPDIDFIPATGQKYGFDKPTDPALNGNYMQAQLRGQQQYIAWKAVQTGTGEPVEAVIPESDKYKSDAFGFKTSYNALAQQPATTGFNKTVTVVSAISDEPEPMTAFYSMKDTKGNTVEAELGRLNIIAYDKIIRNVHIVPVNSDLASTEFTDIKNTLNQTYAQAVASWQVTQNPRFDLAQDQWDINPADNQFQADDADNLMDYTTEQKAVYKAYKAKQNPASDAWYVFLIPHPVNNTAAAGYTIFGKKWIFIYTTQTGNQLARTVAHELGHAAFNLRHTFSNQNTFFQARGTTDNLMDYAQGSALRKYQWDYVHDPETVCFPWLQDEGEGETESQNDIITQICQAVISNGENGCAFVRRINSSNNNGDGIVFNSNTIEYLAGKYVPDKIEINTIATVFNVTTLASLIRNTLKDETISELILYVGADGKIGFCTPQQDYSGYSPLADAADNAVFLEKFTTDYLLCKNTGIFNILQGLQAFARQNQRFELSVGGKIYSLDNNTLKEETTSDADINAGNWTDGNIDMKMRVGFDADGILQFTALGIKNELQIANGFSGKSVTLNGGEESVSGNMLAKNNALLKEHQIKDISATPNSVGANLDSETFPDGQSVKINKGASFVKILCEAGGVSLSFLKTAEIEQSVYLEGQENIIKAPPLATGTLEAGAMAVTDITSMVTTICDLVTDKQARKDAVAGLKAIKDQVVDQPTILFPILGEVALQELTGEGKEGYKEMLNSTTNEGRKGHLISKTSVRTTVSVIASGKFLAKLPEMAIDMAAKMPKAKLWLRFRGINDGLAESLLTKFDGLAADGNKFLDDFTNATDADLNKFLNNPELVEAWEMAVKHADLRTNTTALSKLNDIAGRGRGIDKAKLTDALNGDLGDVLNKATGDDLTYILNRLDAEHFTGTHLNEITNRLKTYPELKTDLLDNPEWFETFDDILQDPGRYWEILSEGNITSGSAMAKWGQGKWWKNLRDLADDFDKKIVKNSMIDEFGSNRVVEQVTLEVASKSGVQKTIRIDNLAFDEISGKYVLGDAKFTTKTKNWNTDWLSSCTDNQKDVFKWFENNDVKDITIKATDTDKIKALSNINLTPNGKIDINNTSLKLYGSNANEQVIGTIVTIK